MMMMMMMWFFDDNILVSQAFLLLSLDVTSLIKEMEMLCLVSVSLSLSSLFLSQISPLLSLTLCVMWSLSLPSLHFCYSPSLCVCALSLPSIFVITFLSLRVCVCGGGYLTHQLYFIITILLPLYYLWLMYLVLTAHMTPYIIKTCNLSYLSISKQFNIIGILLRKVQLLFSFNQIFHTFNNNLAITSLHFQYMITLNILHYTKILIGLLYYLSVDSIKNY